jgi:hypothetical protein
MIVGIHQPEHLPWLGFFNKMYLSNIFVLLDNVQYEKNYFQNRNRIRTSKGFCWITVPVLTKGRSSQLIDEVRINPLERDWPQKVWRTLEQNYRKAPFYSDYAPFLKGIYCDQKWEKLVDLNISIIKQLAKWQDIKTPLVRASDMGVEGQSTDLLLRICQKLKASAYLSGKSGRDYLDESKFTEENIQVFHQNFVHPIYQQLYSPFLPQMSVIDLLMNHGKESLRIIIEGQDSL